MSVSDILERLRALFFRRRRADDLDDELRFHLEQEEAARVRQGADPDAARRDAKLAFGGVDRYKEEVRDASGVRPLEDVAADARFALRSLRRNPGFALTAVTVLSLAIGSAVAVFTVIEAVTLSDLPYPHARRLVMVLEANSPTNRWAISTADFVAMSEHQRSFDAFGAMVARQSGLAGAGTPEQVRTGRVTSGFFAALGQRAATGRLIEPADEPLSAPPVAVVTHRFAEERLDGPAAAIGKSLTLDGVSYAVVGVLPRDVDELAGLTAPIWAALQVRPATRRGPFWLRGIGRLKEGVTLEAATADLSTVSDRLLVQWTADWKDAATRLTPIPLRDAVVGTAHRQLNLFGFAVVLVLLVATANVATLMLVRASARLHELSVRATLGASRARLARLVITESMVLTALSALAGLGVAALGLELVGVIAPNLPRAHEIAIGGGTVLLTAALALVIGILVSISPVTAVLQRSLTATRHDEKRGGGRHAATIRGILVGAEFALALPLLLGAALLAVSFQRLQRVDPGYDPSQALWVRVSLPGVRYGEDSTAQGFFNRMLQRARETPGVVAAGFATSAVPNSQGYYNNFNLVDKPVPEGTPEPVSPWSYATAGFFEALRIPLLEGRMFTDADTGNLAPAALVSRAWADKYYPGESPVGKQLVEGGCYECARTTIVGVVGDVKYKGLQGDGEGVYVALAQSSSRAASLYVRTTADPAGFIRPLIDNLRSLDADLPLSGRTLKEDLRGALADPGRWTGVLAAFAAVALALAALGIFGLMSYVVRQQRREIGVRMALGAEPGDVTRMIVVRGMRYAVPGTVVGLVLALLGARWVEALLYGVTARDPWTMAAVTMLLLGAALLACLLPGLRAARIRPLEAIADD